MKTASAAEGIVRANRMVPANVFFMVAPGMDG
jgi:hypothetical protein